MARAADSRPARQSGISAWKSAQVLRAPGSLAAACAASAAARAQTRPAAWLTTAASIVSSRISEIARSRISPFSSLFMTSLPVRVHCGLQFGARAVQRDRDIGCRGLAHASDLGVVVPFEIPQREHFRCPGREACDGAAKQRSQLLGRLPAVRLQARIVLQNRRSHFKRHLLRVPPPAHQIERGVDRGPVQIALDIAHRCAGPPVSRQPQEHRLQHIFCVAGVARNTVRRPEHPAVMFLEAPFELHRRIGKSRWSSHLLAVLSCSLTHGDWPWTEFLHEDTEKGRAGFVNRPYLGSTTTCVSPEFAGVAGRPGVSPPCTTTSPPPECANGVPFDQFALCFICSLAASISLSSGIDTDSRTVRSCVVTSTALSRSLTCCAPA